MQHVKLPLLAQKLYCLIKVNHLPALMALNKEKIKVVTDRLPLCDSLCARPRFTFWWPLVNLCELPLSDHPSRKTRLYNALKKLAKVQDVELPLLAHKLHCFVKHLHEGPNALFSLSCYWELCSLVACNREANKLHFTSSCKESRA